MRAINSTTEVMSVVELMMNVVVSLIIHDASVNGRLDADRIPVRTVTCFGQVCDQRASGPRAGRSKNVVFVPLTRRSRPG